MSECPACGNAPDEFPGLQPDHPDEAQLAHGGALMEGMRDAMVGLAETTYVGLLPTVGVDVAQEFLADAVGSTVAAAFWAVLPFGEHDEVHDGLSPGRGMALLEEVFAQVTRQLSDPNRAQREASDILPFSIRIQLVRRNEWPKPPESPEAPPR